MSSQTVRLVLRDVEAEVLEEALRLYLAARPAAADRRFDYRYRAARNVLSSLMQRGDGEPVESTVGDDEPVAAKSPWDRRNPERLED